MSALDNRRARFDDSVNRSCRLTSPACTFCSARLVFEPLRAEHAALLFEALADPRVTEHLNSPQPTSIDELAVQFAEMAAGPVPFSDEEHWLNFAVQLQSDGRWIGRIQATVHHDWAEVGYLFGPSDWGRGYAGESLSWLHDYVRVQYGVSEFWATVAAGNERSIRLLLRSGYRRTPQTLNRPLASYVAGDEIFRYMAAADALENRVAS
jgi:ribosomal-protein-alanine N-acetyltransferase